MYLRPRTHVRKFHSYWLSGYLAALEHNGQTLAMPWNIACAEERLRVELVAPARDALALRHHSERGKAALAEVVQRSAKPPRVRSRGEIVGLEATCSCEQRDHAIVSTTFLHDEPPVCCGSCGGRIPLHTLPHMDGAKDHSPILHWESLYRACDTLFMLRDDALERFGYRQTSDVCSEVTREGLRCCRDLTKKTGTPFYYRLDSYYSPPKDDCPRCGSRWKLPEPVDGFTHRCEACLLITDEPANLLPPRWARRRRRM